MASLVGKISSEESINPVEFARSQTPTSFMQLVKITMISWTKESEIEDPVLIREIFRLLYKCYNGIGEVRKADNLYLMLAVKKEK